MHQPAVEVTDLTKSFGGVHAIAQVSMAVPAGQRRAIIGPNGAGKTTLFNCITGSLSPTEGRVILFGEDVTRLPEHRRTALGLGRTFQITNVFHELSVMENVLLAVNGTSPRKWIMHRSVDSYGGDRKQAGEFLELVGLDRRADTSVRHLSYGERRQLEIVLALASEPRVVLLDEPASGLSPGERQNMAAIIKDLPRDITIILIEHDMSIVLGLADQVTVLNHGSLLLEGTPDEIQANPKVREVYLGKA
ncbi:MAG: ABC transporter ATP-binding protein [Deltaproteobacteria bacterium]|nr:ABC transporter ATP-binding protein [Deltaproteobacteria bacterium]